jgi:hypothetical protein
MPEVEQATPLGIIRTTTMKHNIQTNGMYFALAQVVVTKILQPFVELC